MPFVRIIAVPPGDAPLHVRRAWVGLVVPMHVKFGADPHRVSVFGVMTGPRWFFSRAWAYLTGRANKVSGYVLDPRTCVDLLEKKDPEAAGWWRRHASHMLQPGRHFVFSSEVCEVVWDDTPPAK